MALQWILITICLLGIFVHGLVHSVLFLAVPCGSCSKHLSCNASVESLVLLFIDLLDVCFVVCGVEGAFVLHVVPFLVLFWSFSSHVVLILVIAKTRVTNGSFLLHGL